MSQHDLDTLAASLPDGYTVELVGGDLILHPFPSFAHARAIGRIQTALDPWDSDPDGWIILGAVGLVVPEHLHPMVSKDVVGPDLVGWRRSRMAAAPEDNKTDIVPNWVCEVLSSNAAYDRGVKMPLYHALGIDHAWLVDPRACTLEVFTRGAQDWQLLRKAGGNDRVRVEPFGIELALERLWQR